MKMVVYLKSGASFEVDVEEFEYGVNQNANSFTSLNWTTPDGWKTKLSMVILSDISAVIVKR